MGLSNWGLAYQMPPPPCENPSGASLLCTLAALDRFPPPPPEGVAWLSGQLPGTSPGCCLRHQWHRSTRALPRVQTLPLVHWPDWNLLQSSSPFLLDVKCPSPSFAEWSSVPEPPRGVRDRTRPLPLAGREGRRTDCDEWSPEGSSNPT